MNEGISLYLIIQWIRHIEKKNNKREKRNRANKLILDNRIIV